MPGDTARFSELKGFSSFPPEPTGVYNAKKVILALDTPSSKEAFKLLNSLEGLVQNVKVAPPLFIQEGPRIVESLQKKGYRVFLDLKLHDIPNTVALGVRGAKELGVWMLSIHLSGGKKMIEYAQQEAGKEMFLVGITILTSLGQETMEEVGFCHPLEKQVIRMANLAKTSGLKGIVASPHEIQSIRKVVGKEMILITPGIRPNSSPKEKNDQARTATPREALKWGANYLVVGRPVLKAPNPRKAMVQLIHES